MYCKACGKQIDEESVFCRYCGAPQKASGAAQSAEPKWETCEIKWGSSYPGYFSSFGSNNKFWFSADAIGPNGRYEAARSPVIKTKYLHSDYDVKEQENNPEFQNLLNELIKKLTSEGWQPTVRGVHWFSHMFRRRVKE